jgi:RNA polymerase sigma-70 factor (family 1)
MNFLPPDPTDAALLASISQRKESALDTLMKRYWEGLFRKCYSLLRDEDAAKDCVQEIFIAIWNQESVTDILNLEHYLYQAARLRAFAAMRSSKRRARYEEDASKLTSYILHSDALETLELKDLKEKLERVIATFPERKQQVWRMSREEGMSYAQIATELGISQKAVQKQMTKALKSLRNEIGEAMVLAFAIHLL